MQFTSPAHMCTCVHFPYAQVDRAYKQVTALALPYHNIQGPLRAAVRHFLNLKLLAELHLVGAGLWVRYS